MKFIIIKLLIQFLSVQQKFPIAKTPEFEPQSTDTSNSHILQISKEIKVVLYPVTHQ